MATDMRWFGRRLVALRPQDERIAARLRVELPTVLAGLADEVDGEVEVRLWSAADSTIAIEVRARADDEADAAVLGTEVASVLETVAELAEFAAPDGAADTVVRWPVAPARTTATLGYTVVASAAAEVDWSAGPDAVQRSTRDAVLVQLLSGIAEHGLSVTVSASDPMRAQRRPVTVAVLTRPGAAVSLRLRAAVKRTWPGLEVAAAPGSDRVLRMPHDQVSVLAAVPVAALDPLPGVRPGAPAPMPVPVGPVDAQTANGVRIGHGHTATRTSPDVTLGAEERLRHLHVTGRTGTGKSSLLAAVANQVAARGEGLFVLDPHGHLVDRILAELPASATRRTWVIRSGDADRPVPINPLAAADPDGRDRAAEGALDMFQVLFDAKNEGIVGPRFRERVGTGLRALQAVFGSRASLLDVPMALASDGFLDAATEATTDARLRTWLENERASRRSNEHGEVVSWCNSKFEPFTSNPALRAILGSGHDAFDLADAMDEQRIILVDLSKSELGEPASRLLGFLHLNRLWAAALRRRRPELPFTVMVDEAHSVSAGALTSMLSEGRKFGLSVVLAHQFFDQLDPSLLAAVDGNVATSVAFRSSVRDAPALGLRFGSAVPTETLMTLPDLTAVMLRTAAAGVARPHTLTVDHNEKCCPRTGSARDRHAAAVAGRTRRSLVDEFLADAAAARSGQSPVAEFAGTTRRGSGRPGSGNSSFLDEWMAKRRAADTVRAANESQDGSVSDVG